jgi:hypothetical protein
MLGRTPAQRKSLRSWGFRTRRQRKEGYIRHLTEASDAATPISVADKLSAT